MRLFHIAAAAAVLLSASARAGSDTAPTAAPPAPAATAPAAPAAAAPSTHLAAAQRLYQKLDLDAAMARSREISERKDSAAHIGAAA
jgi:hypothetical protein